MPLSKDEYLAGTRFHDRVDPDDPHFRLLELRLGREISSPYMGGSSEGVAARDRLLRFCAAILSGAGYLSDRDAQKILRKHPPRTDP